MELFKKKPSKALAMLGSAEVVGQIIESNVFDAYDIEVLDKDYATIDELIQGIKEEKSVKYVLISDSALIGIENGKYEIIKQIRMDYPNVIIAMFFNDERVDEVYRNWAFGYKVYNIYYENSEGYDFDEIAKELAENVIPTNISNVQNGELEAKEELIRQKEKELAEKAIQLQDLESRLAETESMESSEENSKQTFLLKEQIKKTQEFKEEVENNINNIKEQHELEKEALERKFELEKKELREKADEDLKAQIKSIKEAIKAEQPSYTQARLPGCITIGVFSISNGAGATFTAVNLAERLGAEGFSTAVIACDGSKELKYAEVVGGNAYYFYPDGENKRSTLLKILNEGYCFVIEDFGCLFPISPTGELLMGEISDRKEDIDELLRCKYKIAVGFSSPWNIGKLNFFIENELMDPMTSIYSIAGYTENRDLIKCPLLICERDVNEIAKIMFEWLGIVRNNEKEQKNKKQSRFLFK